MAFCGFNSLVAAREGETMDIIRFFDKLKEGTLLHVRVVEVINYGDYASIGLEIMDTDLRGCTFSLDSNDIEET